VLYEGLYARLYVNPLNPKLYRCGAALHGPMLGSIGALCRAQVGLPAQVLLYVMLYALTEL